MSNTDVPTPDGPAGIGIRLGDTERQLDEAAAGFAAAVEQYAADLAEAVPLPEAQLGLAEFYLDNAWELHARIGRLRERLADPTQW